MHGLSSIIRAHQPALLRFFAGRVADPADAHDLVQEVCLRLVSVNRLELIRDPKAYLFRIAVNIAHEHWHQRASRPAHIEFDDQDQAAEKSPEDQAETAERLEHLSRLLGRLSPKVRAALIWAHRDGHSYEEIGARLAVSKNRVKKYLARALAHCRKSLISGRAESRMSYAPED